jgi:hypothetical protein
MSIADSPMTKLRSKLEGRLNDPLIKFNKSVVVYHTLMSALEFIDDGNKLSYGVISDIRLSMILDKEDNATQKDTNETSKESSSDSSSKT